MIHPKHFRGKYVEGERDCWTLIQDLFFDEYHITLPNYPYAISGKNEEFVQHVHANVELEQVQKADRGCIIAFNTKGSQFHAGFALNSSKYVHRTKAGTKVTDIPNNATIYKYKGLK